MGLESLRILHLHKTPNQDPRAGASLRAAIGGWFHLDSCQRLLWVGWAKDLEDVRLPEVQGLEVLAGEGAYHFLLRVAAGLESQIVGETDIFGQLKEVWRRGGDFGQELGLLMQGLFEDTKEIRSRYLQNLGGASYGSLVRMMLKDCKGPTLVVGAGQIAQSVAPYLLDRELWLLNRGAGNLAVLRESLLSREPAPALRVIAPSDEARAWADAASVVVCIPLDGLKDPVRVAARGGNPGVLIHLGGHREAAGDWNRLPGLRALDDLFALQTAQGLLRVARIDRAARACGEKAKLRALGASVSIPHGWEDLAIFA